jgi:hypothetical protein
MRQSNVILVLALTALAVALFVSAAGAYVPLYSPSEIAVDASGNVYTVMTGGCGAGEGIFVYSANGTVLKSYLRPSCGDIAIDSRGMVYVVNLADKQVERLEKNGSFSVVWREDKPDHFINYFAIDRDDDILLSDFNYSDKEIKATDGWILKISPDGRVTDVIESDPVVSLEKIFKLSAGANGTIYLTDFNRTINVIYPDGSRSTISHASPDNGTFSQVATVEAGKDGFLYVGETSGGQVLKLTTDSTRIASWDGCGPDRFVTPAGIFTDRNGRVYVSDLQDQRIVWFDSNRYHFGENVTENMAGKGVLWDNVIAGDNDTASQREPGGTPGFGVAISLAGISLAGAFLCLGRARKD